MVSDCFDGMSVFALDLETTGLRANSDRIVQYAFVGSDCDGGPVRIEELINPQRAIPYDASRIHGIFNRDVASAAEFSVHADNIHQMMKGSVIVGHNVRRFDMDFITAEFLRLGRKAPQPKAIIDTLEIVRRLKLPRPHNLGALCKRYGIDLVNAHTAAADAAASLLLLWRLMKDHPSNFRQDVAEIERWLTTGSSTSSSSDSLGRGLNDLEPLDKQGRIRIDGDDLILAFGRHKASSLKQVKVSDAPYLNWLISPASLIDEESRELVKQHISSFNSA
ncbi:MAG: 3'-5' exonuclease [Candidatus Poseidoniales archaeon]